MRTYTYRYPTSVLWMADEDGYKRLTARNARHALQLCPRSDITAHNLQVEIDGEWQWAEDVPLQSGGIMRWTCVR